MERKEISRRQALKLFGVGLGSIAVSGGVGYSLARFVSLAYPKPADSLSFSKEEYDDAFFNDILFPKEMEKRIGEALVSFSEHNNNAASFQLTPDRVVDYLHRLESGQNLATKEVRAEAVFKNTSFLFVDFEVNSETINRYLTTCLKINKAGVYLTAAHGFGIFKSENKQPSSGTVFDIATSKAYKITSALVNKQYDLAAFIAPTGEDDQPIENMELSLSPLRTGQRLWQYITNPTSLQTLWESEETAFLIIKRIVLSGYVDNPPEEFVSRLGNHLFGLIYPPDSTLIRGRIRLQGMMSFDGASGAPVINSNGRLVAIESGIYSPSDNESLKGDYIGAVVAPVSNVKTAFQEAKEIKVG